MDFSTDEQGSYHGLGYPTKIVRDLDALALPLPVAPP